MKEILKINEKDNVVVALKDLSKNEIIEVDNKKIEIKEEVKRGHKIAINNISINEDVIKYGYSIGHATKDIQFGEGVHTHNIKTNLDGIKDYTFNQKLSVGSADNKNITFQGYERENGNVGIRNELWIVPTVGCINGIADMILKEFEKATNPTGIDHLHVYKHNYGCSQLGDDHANTRTILGNVVKHPNAGGVLVVSLGCENNNIVDFKKSLCKFDEKRTKFLVLQEVSDEIEEGVKLLKELYENMKNDTREEVPLSELKVGLKCGGSDGFSGITSNPLIGEFSDYLISQGGTTVLTEVPEMFGAETILMNRAESEEVFGKIVNLVNDFKQYFIDHNQPVYFIKNGQEIYENPSPGNKEGGITTLEDKSLGCTQKGGSAKVVDVLNYGDVVEKKGLNLLQAPGNDLVSSTAMGASGCHMVLFSTGRGTPYGCFVPTIKISSNTNLSLRKPHWIGMDLIKC